MAPFLNPDVLAQLLQRQKQLAPSGAEDLGNPDILQRVLSGQPPVPPGPAGPPSTGAAVPHGLAPGGDGTAIGPSAGPRNPAVISNPDDIRTMQTRILEQMTAPIKVGAPPQAPNLPPAPTMSPYPSGLRGRLVAGLSGIAGQPNPLEAMRRQQFQDQLQGWQAQVAPLQETYGNQLKAYEAQTKAELESAQAQRYGAMASSYLAPYFGISRSGTTPGKSATANQIGKVDQQNGLPIAIMTSEGRQPITEDYLTKMEPTIRDIALNALDAHSRWFGEQLKMLQARGASFRLNMMYPVWDKQVNQLVNKTGFEILADEYRYIPAPSALTMARTFGVAPTQDVIRRGQNAAQTLQQLPILQYLYQKVDEMGMTGPTHGRMFADFMAGKIGTTGMGPEADAAMGQLRASNEFFRTRLTQAHLGGQSSEAERAAIRDILGRLSSTPEMYRGGLDSAESVLHDYASAVPGFGGGVGAITANPFQDLPLTDRTGNGPPSNPSNIPKNIPEYVRGADGKLHLKGQK